MQDHHHQPPPEQQQPVQSRPGPGMVPPPLNKKLSTPTIPILNPQIGQSNGMAGNETNSEFNRSGTLASNSSVPPSGGVVRPVVGSGPPPSGGGIRPPGSGFGLPGGGIRPPGSGIGLPGGVRPPGSGIGAPSGLRPPVSGVGAPSGVRPPGVGAFRPVTPPRVPSGSGVPPGVGAFRPISPPRDIHSSGQPIPPVGQMAPTGGIANGYRPFSASQGSQVRSQQPQQILSQQPQQMQQQPQSQKPQQSQPQQLQSQFAQMGVKSRAKRVYQTNADSSPGGTGGGILQNQSLDQPPSQQSGQAPNQFQPGQSLNQFQPGHPNQVQPGQLPNQFQQGGQPLNQFQPGQPVNQFQPGPPNQFLPGQPPNQLQHGQFQPSQPPNQFQPGQPVNRFQPGPPNQFQPGHTNQPQPGNQFQQPGEAKPRIDPDQIPSPVKEHEKDQELYATAAFGTASRGLPPYSSTRYRGIDEGNSNPRFIRSTLYNIPITEEILKSSHIPFGLIIQPLADLLPEESPIAVVDFGKNGPIRCSRCGAYVNPHFQFINGGRVFICNLCQFSNTCPDEYYSALDMSGRRMDMHQRPELLYGSVEFAVQDQYCARPPSPAGYLFAIDVSVHSIQTGMLATFCSALKHFLYSGAYSLPPKSKIGIMTFDKTVQFYNLHVLIFYVA
jgi:protein transport protein SEC24